MTHKGGQKSYKGPLSWTALIYAYRVCRANRSDERALFEIQFVDRVIRLGITSAWNTEIRELLRDFYSGISMHVDYCAYVISAVQK